MTELGLLQILSSVLLNSGQRSKNWQEYGGTNNLADSIISRSRALITQMASQLPMGLLWGPYAADYLVGDDFNRGVLHNTLSGLSAPSTGTYAGNFQNMWNKQTVSALRGNRLNIQKLLRGLFLRNYYRITTGETDEKKLNKLALDAGPLSLPRVLNYLADPVSNGKILDNIKSAQSGVLSWSLRQNARLHFGFGLFDKDRATPREMAEGLGNKIKDMAVAANRYALGEGSADQNAHFGGFAGALISLLANILSNASLQLNPKDLEGSLKTFENKVKETARALSPLKDIFGRDVKAITDMLQSVTGQNISQLSPTMIKSLATSTVDMSRYSGASVAQIAQAGQSIMAMSAGMGGTSFSRIGASTLGGLYTGLISLGNAPAGVHAAEYAASTKRAVASAQASQGVDWSAMAYGIWAEKQLKAGKDASMQTFLKQVSDTRNGGASSMMLAVIRTAGVSSQELLLRGRGTTLYRTALQDPGLARLGILLQYRLNLQNTMWGLMGDNTDPDVTPQQYAALLQFLSDSKNASEIKKLTTNANNKSAVRAWADKHKLSYSAVNNFLASDGALEYTTRWASQEEIRQYLAVQAEVRKLLLPLEAYNAGGNFTFFNALTNSKLSEGLGGKVTMDYLGKKISLSTKAFGHLARGVLGVDNIAETQKRVGNLKDIFGARLTANVLTDASNKVGKDERFVSSVQTLAELGDYDKLTKTLDKENWNKSFLYVVLTQMGMSLDQFKTPLAKKYKDLAIAQYRDRDRSKGSSTLATLRDKYQKLTKFGLGQIFRNLQLKSNALAAIDWILQNPERAALLQKAASLGKTAKDLGLKGDLAQYFKYMRLWVTDESKHGVTGAGRSEFWKSDEQRATLNLKKNLAKAARIEQALKLDINSFLGTDLESRKKKLTAFRNLIKSLLGMLTKLLFLKKNKKDTGGMSYQEYTSAYKLTTAGYNLKDDTMRSLKTVAELLLRWLRKHA